MDYQQIYYLILEFEISHLCVFNLFLKLVYPVSHFEIFVKIGF